MRIADTTVDIAATEPTDRSIPPVTITKNWPTASTEVIEAAVMILTRFRAVRKYGDMAAPITRIIANTTNKYSFESAATIRSRCVRSGVLGVTSAFWTVEGIHVVSC